MRCPSCHAETSPGAESCARCGAPLITSEDALELAPAPPSTARAASLSAPRRPTSLPALAAAYVAPLIPRAFGPAPDPAALPSTSLQATLRRALAGGRALNLWFMSLLGAAVALVAGLVLSGAVYLLWSDLIKGLVENTASVFSISGLLGGSAAPFLRPNLLQFFVLEHHVPLVVHFAASARGGTGAATGVGTLTLPLLGLGAVPALALTLGGALAATSDYTRGARFSLARGALIAPWYAALLFVLALFSSSALPGKALGLPGTVTVGPNPLAAFLAGLCWGALFGAFGGWIQLSGRHWLAGALPMLRSARNPLPGAALAGAVVSLVSGMLLFLAVGGAALALVNVRAASDTATSAATQAASQLHALGGPRVLAELLLILGPTAAIWALTFATGAALTFSQTASAPSGGTLHATVGLLGAQHAPTSHGWLLLALVPVICYLVGGRVAARAARAGTVREGGIAGALVALPLSVLAALLAAATSASATASLAGARASEGAGPSVGGTFLATLLLGAVVGGLGGMSEVALPRLGEAPRWLLAPVRGLGRPLFAQLDALTGRAAGEPLTAARAWFYDGMLATALLGALAFVADLATILSAWGGPSHLLTTLDSWLAAALVGLPLSFFIGALVVSFSSPAPVPAFFTGAPAPMTTTRAPSAPLAPSASRGTAPLGLPTGIAIEHATPPPSEAVPVTPPAQEPGPAEPDTPAD